MIHFNVVPVIVTAGLAYVLMALTVWGLLRRVPYARVVRTWTLGSVLGGLTLMLLATRGLLPDLIGYGLPACLGAASLAFQLQALRMHIGLPSRARQLGVLWLLACTINLSTVLGGQLTLHVVLSAVMLAVAAALLAWHAWLTAQHQRSRSIMLLAWSHAVLVLALLYRALSLTLGWSVLRHPIGGLDDLVLHATAALAALYGNLGFVGMVLDITRRAEAGAREAQVAESTRREAAEGNAQALRLLLAQRDRLASERERMLQLLAHEIRQPLHNASGALQAALLAMQASPAASVLQVSVQLGRAQTVLGEVRSVLDNTLAAASQLSRSAPLSVQEVDLDFLVDLALGDLGPAQRAAVQVQWQTDLRQAEVEPGLLRLALRNLLVNAFGHGGPGVVVQLQVSEQAQPPALLLRVVDDGPGLPDDQPADAAGDRRPGLGLTIVRQVAALHGGRLDLLPNAPHGLQAVLVLPLPAG